MPMVKVRQDLSGRVFGRLLVIKQVEDYISPNGIHYAQWLCRCNCKEHNTVIVRGDSLKNKLTESCGCIQRKKSSESITNVNKRGHENKYSEKLTDKYGEYYIGWTSNTNNEFYVDAKDYETIKKYCWSEYITEDNYHMLRYSCPNKSYVTMAHLLVGKYYDHADRNPLNNRRYNLRIANNSQNAQNRSVRFDNTSGVTGVCYNKRQKEYIARISDKPYHRIVVYRGDDKQEAIIARLKAELKYYGEFAPQRHLFEQYGIHTTQNDRGSL